MNENPLAGGSRSVSAGPLTTLDEALSAFWVLCCYGGTEEAMGGTAPRIVPALRALGLEPGVDAVVTIHRGRVRWRASWRERAEDTRKPAEIVPLRPTYRDGDNAGLLLVRERGGWEAWRPGRAERDLAAGVRALLVHVDRVHGTTRCQVRVSATAAEDLQVSYTRVASDVGEAGLRRELAARLEGGVQ
ncbi:MAG: hypothetical protein ACOZNI_35300 [Myxococcota bacterium]